jgi:xylan 1,4-beta-xylosidase
VRWWDALLDREVRLTVQVPGSGVYTVTYHRIDTAPSNIVAVWERMRDGAGWPDDGQWEQLAAANLLEELVAHERVEPESGELSFGFSLPMPAVSYLEFVPEA